MNVLGLCEVKLMHPAILCRDDHMLEVVVGSEKAAQAGNPVELREPLRRSGSSGSIPMNFVEGAIVGSGNHVLGAIVIRVVSRNAIDTASDV